MLQLKAGTNLRNAPKGRRADALFLLTRIALQNMQRRPLRTVFLIFSVALAVGTVLAVYTAVCGVATSVEQGFARMGADLIVVPEKTMVNITSALLTVQPTEESIDWNRYKEISQLNGVERASPQTIYHVPVMAGMPEHKTNLIAFDPATDFTVMPWLVAREQRPIQVGELISGGRRSEAVGSEIEPCNTPATIYGKLGRSGIGPFDDSLFAPYETASKLLSTLSAQSQCTPQYSPYRVSAVLVKLKFGSTPEQVRFAISRLPGVKVIQGTAIVTATRQSTTALLDAVLGLAVIMLVSSLILIGLLFSAIIAERRREIGVLQAIGARRSDVLGMLIAEATVTTGMGGLLGVLLGCLLLFLFQNSLVYYLKTLQMDFLWPPLTQIALAAGVLILLAAAAGLMSAVIPAWQATKKEPYILIQGEDG
jgi:putative ABC transport system permease protein